MILRIDDVIAASKTSSHAPSPAPPMGGMPGMEGMDMAKMQEMFNNLSPDQKEHIEKLAKAQMESQNADGPKGYDGPEVNEID